MTKPSQWPQWKKDQYNFEVRRRKHFKLKKELALDSWLCPQLWRFPLTEENVFAMLAHVFPFNHVIRGILRHFYPTHDGHALALSWRYLYLHRKVVPGYYSDRERIIVMLNRYRSSEDLEDFVRWLPFHQDRHSFHLLDLMIGLFFLDHYLGHLERRELLHVAIRHLDKGKGRFRSQEAKLAFSSLIAFCHYMNQNFNESLVCLELRREDKFQERFSELIKKVA